MPSFLALDVGNTAVKAGLWVDGAWAHVARFASEEVPAEVWATRFRAAFGDAAVGAAGVASVVPALTANLKDAVRRAWSVEPVGVSGTMALPDMLAPFRVAYRTPDTRGADRVAAAAAAYPLHGRPAGRAVIALDAGTAVTLDAVTAGGAFLGGAILPGPGLLARALARGTAQLPEVGFDPPESPIGRTTGEALRSGLAYLALDGLAGLLERTARSLAPGGPPPLVVATGGWAPALAAHLPLDAVAPHLVLDGVRLLGGA